MKRTITVSAVAATLSTALLSACSGTPKPDIEPAPTGEKAPSPEPVAETEPAPDPEPAEDPKPVAATELPGEREKPIAGTMPAEGSKRTGSMACCGTGTCGSCEPLPEKRKEPKAPKNLAHPAKKDPSKSARKGAASCCGAGTCGPC